MTDLLALAVMLAVAIGCGLTVAFISFLFETRDDASSDCPHGDVIALPDDFESSFHSQENNRGV